MRQNQNIHYNHAVERAIRRAEESDCNRKGWKEEGAGDIRRSHRNLVVALDWEVARSVSIGFNNRSR